MTDVKVSPHAMERWHQRVARVPVERVTEERLEAARERIERLVRAAHRRGCLRVEPPRWVTFAQDDPARRFVCATHKSVPVCIVVCRYSRPDRIIVVTVITRGAP